MPALCYQRLCTQSKQGTGKAAIPASSLCTVNGGGCKVARGGPEIGSVSHGCKLCVNFNQELIFKSEVICIYWHKFNNLCLRKKQCLNILSVEINNKHFYSELNFSRLTPPAQSFWSVSCWSPLNLEQGIILLFCKISTLFVPAVLPNTGWFG